MVLDRLFQEYGLLASAADKAFHKMAEEYGECIKCRRGCTDCCHAVFGLFLVEAAFINCRFNELGREKRAEVLSRVAQADKELDQLQRRLACYTEDPHMQAYVMSRERLRCPLLNESEECDIYPFRPITCRVYGIPVAIQGRARVCWKAAFERGKSYPAFDLDAAYEHLYRLSKKLLAEAGQRDTERASYLVSVSKSLQTPLKELIRIKEEE